MKVSSIQHTNKKVRFELESRRYNLLGLQSVRLTIGTFINYGVKERSHEVLIFYGQNKTAGSPALVNAGGLWECPSLGMDSFAPQFRELIV